MPTERAVFHIDVGLDEARATQIIKHFESRIREADAAAASRAEKAAALDPLIDSINQTLGVEADNHQRLNQRQAGVFFLGFALEFAPPGRLEVTLVDRERMHAHLRDGGTLPGVSYDAEADRPYVRIDRNVQRDSRPEERWLTDITMTVKPGQPIDEIGKTWLELVHVSDDLSYATMLHEVAEFTLFQGWAERRLDPHCRWFSDGLANAVTLQLLREHGYDNEEKQWLEFFNPDEFEDLRHDLNLRYWLEATFEPKVDIADEGRRRTARYAFSTREFQRLIETNGTAWIGEVLEQLETAEDPGSRVIIDAIRRHTGVDMDPRLDAYQTFTTRAEGIDRYATAYGQAMQAGDAEAALTAAIRLLEVQFISLQQGLPSRTYAIIANLLERLGRPDEARDLHRQVTGADRDSASD